MAMLLSGKAVAAALSEAIAARVERLTAVGITPTLAIVRVGERADDVAYEKGAMKRCEKLGVVARSLHLPETVTQAELIGTMDAINDDAGIHGCLLLRPLPQGIDEESVRNRLFYRKDVDGMTDGSLAGVFTGTSKGYPPCTAEACLAILDHYGIDIAGKRVTVVGRSAVIGKPVAMQMLKRNATVTICHTKTMDLPAVCREADILLVAAGRIGVIGAEHVSPGQTVIDVGIHVDADGKLCGDVAFAAVEPIVGAITPVPGGVGAVTTVVLLKHVLAAAEELNNVAL